MAYRVRKDATLRRTFHLPILTTVPGLRSLGSFCANWTLWWTSISPPRSPPKHANLNQMIFTTPTVDLDHL